MIEKQCSRCKQVLPISKFQKDITRPSGYEGLCKKCRNDLRNEWSHKTGRSKSYKENALCPLFLGIHVAEELLLKTFKNVKRMPPNNPGFDFICGKGFKVDVKSSCLRPGRWPYWQFHINHNTTADYFACIAFDNRYSLNPLHFWLIPGGIVNTKMGINIHPAFLNKWSGYENPLDKISLTCDLMRHREVRQLTLAGVV
ncbi:MAG: hypothetical protein ABSE07_02315 [Methanoregula sp.]